MREKETVVAADFCRAPRGMSGSALAFARRSGGANMPADADGHSTDQSGRGRRSGLGDLPGSVPTARGHDLELVQLSCVDVDVGAAAVMGCGCPLS